MKKVKLVLMVMLVALLLAACGSKPIEYESLKGEVTGTLTYECPRCHTHTLRVEAGKAYGICTRCDEKYFIDK